MAESLQDLLPPDYASGLFIGRALSPAGPCVIVIREGRLFDLTGQAATVAGAIERKQISGGDDLGPVEHGLPSGWTLLSPVDLQCVKACGVTFAVSAIERVIEERARGDASKAAEIRAARWSARRSATTSTCAISKAARRCCCRRPRITPRAARSGR